MPNELPLPPELQHLIEKREADDRRVRQRRTAEAVPDKPSDAAGAASSAGNAATKSERRSPGNRRQKKRRDGDA